MKGWGLRMNRPPKTKLSMALGGVLLAASASVLVLMSQTSHAAGLGKLSVNSALGQPLSAEIELVSLQPGEFEALVARVASPESYTDARVEYSPLLRLLKFSAERRADGKSILKITSNAPINEPFLDVLVEMNWPAGRLLREYPILLDPPGFNEARVSAPVAIVTATPTARPVVPAKGAASANVGGVPSAKAESAADTYGPVKRGDTLNKIASGLKSDGISLEQMLVALYRENKAAFINNNMNQLKTGQILRVPSAADAGKISKGEAQKEIQVQVADWKGYREQVAGAVAASAGKAASNEASGKIAVAKPAQPTPAASSTDQLKIAKTEVVGGKAGSANAGAAAGGKNSTQDQLNAMKEDAIAKDNKIKEANSRVVDLEKQIADMRKLIELKGMAVPAKPEVAKVAPPDTKAAQVTPAAATPAVVATATVTPVVIPTLKPGDAPKVNLADAAKPADASKGLEAPKVTTPAATPVVPPVVTPAVAPAAAAKAPVKTTPPPAPEPSFIEENAVAIGAGIFALLGAGALLAFMSRRRKKSGGGNTSQLANTSSIMPSDLKPNSSLGNRGGGLVDTGNSSFLTDFDKTGPGSMDTDEVDPVAEAEVYIAYGRDAQAEEILKEAMTRDKNRHEIAFKLLEIYHTRKSVQAFETVARELKDTAGVDHPLWAKAAAMGASIDPGNSLYGGTGQAYAATGAFVAGGAAMVAGAEMAGTDHNDKSAAPPDLDFDLGFSDQAGTDLPLDVAAVRTGEQPASAMDFDLDLNAPGSLEQVAHKPAALDFDLEFDAVPVSGSGAATTLVSTTAEPAVFDFDLSALSLDEPVHAVVAQEQFSSTVAIKTMTTTTTTTTASSAVQSGGLSFSDLSLDLEGPDDSSTSMSSSSGGANAVATKLELAKAYIEIGDSEGAKDILAEVAREGNAAQQEEVKKILAGL